MEEDEPWANFGGSWRRAECERGRRYLQPCYREVAVMLKTTARCSAVGCGAVTAVYYGVTAVCCGAVALVYYDVAAESCGVVVVYCGGVVVCCVQCSCVEREGCRRRCGGAGIRWDTAARHRILRQAAPACDSY